MKVLRDPVNAVIAEDMETLPALVADDVVSHLPGTNQLSLDHKWNEEFFKGFFAGPRAARR